MWEIWDWQDKDEKQLYLLNKKIEAMNNMTMFDLREGKNEMAKNLLENECKINEFLYEPFLI